MRRYSFVSGPDFRHFPRIFLTALIALLLSVSLLSKLHAQESPANPEAPRPAASNNQAKPGGEAAAGQESGGPDENAALRYSPAVHWIADKTGLSVHQAYWVCTVLNFAVIVVVLWVPLRKMLPALFKGRSESIQKGIEEARKTSEEARRRLREVEGRLSRLDVEITEMRREAEENARAEEKRILADVEAERQRIVASAEQEIAMAANAARRELKSYAADLAVGLAEKRIQVGKDTDRELIREFTARLGKDGN